MEEIDRNVQNAVREFQAEIERGMIPINRRTYQCQADCSDEKMSVQQIEACMQNCQGFHQRVQQHIQFAANDVQNGIQKCALNCESQMGSGQNPPGGAVNPLGNQAKLMSMQNCLRDCVNLILDDLPKKTKKLITKMKKMKV